MAILAILVLLLAASISLVSSQSSFHFPGNISNYLLFQGDARNESNRLVFRPPPPTSNLTLAFYVGNLKTSDSDLIFTSNFVFQMLGGSYPFGFGAFVTSYNFPSCISNNMDSVPEIYSCYQFILAFNYHGEDKISLLNSTNSETLVVVNSSVNLSSGSPLQAWIEYHRAPHPDSIRLWVAETGAPRPVSPVLDYKLSYPGSYLFPGFIGCYNSAGNSTSCVQYVNSWSLSVGAPSDRRRGKNLVAWVSALVSAVVVLIFLASLYLAKRVQTQKQLRKKQALLVSNAMITYSFRELRVATNNFKEIIGKGGSCTVYRGVLGVAEVAVKDMSRSDPSVEQQFFEELNVISQVRHHNLVALRGWCHEGERLLLVYEFMSKGSLDKLLFRSSEPALGWIQRLRIIKSVAEGLNYLHEGLGKRIVHRDIKAANVLLDEGMNAKLGDFGLARLLHNTVGDQTMTKAGTLGYISPELAYTGRATEKSDVYGFGILVLEIVAGRRCVESRFAGVDEDRVVLLDWVWRMYESGRLLEEVVDERMNEVDGEEAVKVLELGLVCCSFDAAGRPSMRMCCRILNGESPSLEVVPALARAMPASTTLGLRSDQFTDVSTSSQIFQSESSL